MIDRISNHTCDFELKALPFLSFFFFFLRWAVAVVKNASMGHTACIGGGGHVLVVCWTSLALASSHASHWGPRSLRKVNFQDSVRE